MRTQRHLTPIAASALNEITGPAEGQYSITLRETLTQEMPCFDAYSFTLDQEAEGVCFGIVLETIQMEKSALIFDVVSAATCELVALDIMVTPDTASRICLPSLPAGEYLIGVAGVDMEGVWEYALTIEAPGPVGLTLFEDDICAYEGPCAAEGTPAAPFGAIR